MKYIPKIITGRVKDTGWPIDGHVLTLSQWAYDNYESWHLYAWEDTSDEAVMMTMFQSLKEICMLEDEDLEYFKAAWQAGEFEPPGAFCLELDKVEVLTVVQEEGGGKGEKGT